MKLKTTLLQGMLQLNLTNGSSSSSKSKLEEPANKIFTGCETIKKKALVADKTFFGRVCSAVSKSIPNRPTTVSSRL